MVCPERILERPKSIYNEQTKKYIMWAHLDDLATRKNASVGVAISDSVCGRYTFLAGWRPLGFQSRDIGVFKDDDGSAYLLTEDVSQHNNQKNLRLPRYGTDLTKRPNGIRIDALTNDYLNVTKNVFLWPENIEAPAILKHDGYYFMFGSTLSGWSPNDNVSSSFSFLYSGAISGS